MSVDRRLLNWGVFLVLLGGVPLAVAQGWIPRDTVARAWELWPFILIGAGIGLILSRTPLRALGGIIVAATAGTILGAMLAVGLAGFGTIGIGGLGCGAAAVDAPQIVGQQGTFAGGTGRVTLAANCADLRVGTAAGSGWSVAVRGTDNARPTLEQSGSTLAVRSPSTPAVLPFSTQRSTWQVDLGTDTRMDLEVDLNAGTATVDLGTLGLDRLSFQGNAVGNTLLDLSRATVGSLEAQVNAGDVSIALPATAGLTGAVQGNAASVSLCAPAGVGLRLTVDDNITASNNYAEQGLVKSGSTWESANYAGAATRIDLRTTGSAVSFTLNPKDGCR